MLSRFSTLGRAEQILSLTRTAKTALVSYGYINAEVCCINYLTNATFSVKTNCGKNYALRININSQRSRANILAEIEWVQFLQLFPSIRVPSPIMNLRGDFFTSVVNYDTQIQLNCVLYEWLDGQEVQGNPSTDELYTTGQALAHMHKNTQQFKLSEAANLPIYRDLLWGKEDFLFGSQSILKRRDRKILLKASDEVMRVLGRLFDGSNCFIIHGDIHWGNLISHNGKIYIIDFDNCGFGLAVQDIAVAMHYLETSEQRSILIAGYESVMALPSYSEGDMQALLMQRQLIQLNYLIGTKNNAHRAELPARLANTMESVSRFLKDVRE
jgi:Ser/Thr protein kinase RdoA (MazF antagonist)